MLKNKKIDDSMLLTRAFKVTDFRATQVQDELGGRLEGHAAVFNSKTNIGDWYYEIIERGAFDGTDFDDVLFFINHNANKIPLARSRRNNGNSTMQLNIDDVGLFVRATLDLENNPEARQLYSSIGRGDIDGMSFMFRVKEHSWEDLDTDMPTRHILKIAKVYEVSAVNWPAYPLTDINARDKSALDNAKLVLENARSQELENSKAIDIQKLKNKIIGGIKL
jgi:HK97 family phage prohead protease